MGKSYKKTPYWGEPKNTFLKRNYNRRLRRKKLQELYDNGGSYQKMYQRWDICDYCGFEFNREAFIEEFINEDWKWKNSRRGRWHAPTKPDRKEAIIEFNRLYRNK